MPTPNDKQTYISAAPKKETYISAAPKKETYMYATPQKKTYISSATPKSYISAVPNDNKQSQSKSSLWKITKIVLDKTVETLQNMDDFISNEVKNLRNMGANSQASIMTRYRNFATGMDPQMKKLKGLITRYTQRKDSINHFQTLPKAKFEFQQRGSQSKLSTQKMIANAEKQSIRRQSDSLIKQLEKYNLIQKIQNYLNKNGLKGKINIGKLKSMNLPKVKLNVRTVLKVWGLKDIIWDLLQYKEWGTDSWWEDLKKDIYAFLDEMVVGFASMVIAEIIVGIGVAVAGLTISAGWIVLIVAVVAVIISSIVLYFMDNNDVSFSRTAMAGYKAIIDAGKTFLNL